MFSFSSLDARRGCKNLTVRSVQSTQRRWRPHLIALAALFALVQAPLFSQAAGIPALGVGDSGIWASAQLFENTLLGVVGAEGWTDLFSGKMQWSDPKVKEAMKLSPKCRII